ncbi:MAG: PAS domain S-box protein [Campylobacterales bacterium]|nr:PAS domain S-box protein [Campylobacterales bacterium]
MKPLSKLAILLVTVCFIVSVLWLVYGLMEIWKGERVHAVLHQQVERFEKNWNTANQLHHQQATAAFAFFDTFADKEAAFSLLKKAGRKVAVTELETPFSPVAALLRALDMTHIEYIFDVDFSSRLPFYLHTLSPKGLLLEHFFPLSATEGVVLSVSAVHLLARLEEQDDGAYAFYLPSTAASVPSALLAGYGVLGGDGFSEQHFLSLSLKERQVMLQDFAQGKEVYHAITQRETAKIALFVPIFSHAQEGIGAYVAQMKTNSEIEHIDLFFQRHYFLMVLLLFVTVVFGYWMWQKRTEFEYLNEVLMVEKENTESLIDHAECGIASVNAHGVIERFNQKFADIMQMDRMELVNENFLKLLGERQTKELQRIVQRRGRGSFVHAFKNPKGRSIEIDSLVSFLPKRKSFTFIVMSREEKRALEKALKRLHLYFNHSDLGHIVLNELGYITDVNVALCEVTWFSREELIGKSMKAFFASEGLYENWKETYLDASQVQGVSGIEYRMRRKNGTIFWVEMFGNSFMDGEYRQSVWSIRDITARVNSRNVIERLNKQLQEQFVEIETILDVIPMPIFIKDKTFRYKGCNAAFCQFFSIEKEAMVGKRVEEVFANELALLSVEKDASMANLAYQKYHAFYIAPDTQEQKVLEFHKKAIYKEGEFEGFVGVIVDITSKEKQKEILEKQIRFEVEKNIRIFKQHQEEQIKEAKFSSIGKMAAGITHEINTPLTYVKGNMEMLQADIERIDNAPLRQSMNADAQVILEGLSRIANIIESMRKASQKSTEEKEVVNIYATLVSALTLSYSRAHHVVPIILNEQPFHLNVSKETLVANAFVQKQRIEQVWVIIISNALDELVKMDSFDARQFHICVFEKGAFVHVRFQDNAGGIDPAILPTLFEPFVSTKESSGMGIGLNIAQKIVTDQGGEIRAHNENGGAVFEVILPKEEYV